METSKFLQTRRYLQNIYLKIEDYTRDEIKNALLEAIELIDEARTPPKVKKKLKLDKNIQRIRERLINLYSEKASLTNKYNIVLNDIEKFTEIESEIAKLEDIQERAKNENNK